MASSTARHQLHTTCLIVCAWTQRSWPGGPPFTHLWRTRWWLQSLKSFPPRMSVPNFSERSWPSYKRLRFLRCLRGLRRRPTCSCCAVTPFSGTSISSPQFSPPCVQRRLKVIMWLVLNQRYFKRGSGPSDKLIVWQAHQWLSPDRKKSSPARSRHPRRRLLGLLCLTGWALLLPQRRGRSHRSRPFQLAPEGPVHGLSKEARSLASLLMLHQPRNVDGFQVGARLADFAPHWRSLLGNCRATGIVKGRGGHCIPATTSAHPSKHQFPDQEQPTRPSASRRCLVDEGGHRTCHQREVPGFLQSVVSGTQEDRRSATCDRPVHSQPSHGGSTLQDGDARVRPLSHQKSGVGGVHRHTRCLSSCADASSCPQVSAFRGQQEGVPVHLSSVWTGNFSTGVHQAAETRRLSVEAARCEATRLLRRLADQSRYTGGSSTAFSDNHQGPPVSRMDHQLREVRPHTKSRLPVHWDAVQHSTLHSGAPAENANKGPVSSSTLDGQSEYNCQRSAQASRHVGVHGLAGSTRTAPSSSSPMVGRYSMVPEDRELVRPDSSSTVGSVRGGMVVIPSSPARSTPRRQGDGSDSLHRCVQFGLGSPVRLTLDTGTVVSISTIVPHKRSRDAGCHLCCERLPTSSEVPCGETDVRQRSDGGVHQERGGHEIAHFDADDHSTAQVVRQQGDYVGSRPSARSTQYPGGFPVQSRPDSDHGVDDGHGESTTSVCQVGRTTDRYVCDIRQQTTRQVRFAISGPQGGVDRCHVHALGQGEGPLVCLPAIQDGSASSAEDRSITRTAGDTDRSTATGSIMVSRADEPNPRRPGSPVRGRSRPAHTRRVHGRGRDRNSSLPTVKSSRVETLRAILRAKGHSREAANMMSRCLRESSQQVYESHWSRFVAFCRTKKWQVFQVRSHHFSTYMMHLFRDDLLPSTIISHRTSVASVLRHWVYDPAADPNIKLLVRAFRLERPVQRRIMPKWDLHLVLLSLMRPPFTSQSEDDGESSDDVIPLKWRTLKCLFLLALASARRRSYLHALSIAPGRCVFARGNTQRQLVVSLLPEPGFLAKNQLPTQAPEWITVPGIAHLNPAEPERMLCPVRQLKLYIRDSESIRGGRQRMFLHWNRSIRDIMRSHISRWIVETVKEAYTQADRQFDRVTAHEVRALSASWAYNCQVALPDILAAAFWRSSGVFQNSYLRDMACVAEGMSTLGPVVVAQHVVDPGHLHPPP